MKFQQTFCVVDEVASLLWAGGDWDEFARVNGGHDVMADKVLSKSLYQFIADQETAQVMMTIIDKVLAEQGSFHLRYRCDSPSFKRDLLMTVTPMRDRRLLFTHDLLDSQAMPFQGESWSHDPDSKNMKCSFCCSVKTPSADWTDPFSSDMHHPAKVAYTVCASCGNRIRSALSDIISGHETADPAQVDRQQD